MARTRDDEQTNSHRMGIGSRLLLLLAIPLTALLVVTGYGVYQGATQARAAAELTERTDLALASYALVEDLQAERQLLVTEDRTSPELRASVDVASDELARQAGEVGGSLQASTDAALSRVAASRSVAERELGGAVALRVYSSAVDDLLDVATQAIDPAGEIDDAPATTTDYLARAQAASAEERDLVTVLMADDALDAQSFQEVMSLASAQESYTELAAASAPTALAVQIRQVGFGTAAADTLRRETLEGTDRSAAWIAGLDQRTSDLASLQRNAEARTVAAVDQLAANSRMLLATAALSAIAILLISILLLRRAIRSIARPLQDLAGQAEDVARVRLPEAVATQQLDGVEAVHLPALRASGAAEVHEVAHAFNEVQETALRLASEQAALRRNQGEALTNLGRRNQTLLARQLDFISSLETRETDPAFLDHLFKLDHLASRMRRNAESLLILAGSETPRRRRSPAPISELVRAAMSEVEEFERVRIGNVRDATIAGPSVIDLIHLLAELIENALSFSPPDTTVEIDGRSLGQGGYQFAIIDHGVGMTDVELLAANQRLRGLDELEGMPTRYLGQYVVARLAAKTGALVRLQPSTGGRGVTALVILPSKALVGERDRDAVAQPLPGSRAAREQGPVPFAPGAAVASSTETTIESADSVRAETPATSGDIVAADAFLPTPEPFSAEPFTADEPFTAAEPFAADEPFIAAEPFAEDEAFTGPESYTVDESFADPQPSTSADGVTTAAPIGMFDRVIDTEVVPDDPPSPIEAAHSEPAPSIQDVMPWLVDQRQADSSADPWQSFMGDEEPDDGLAAPSMPPPAPSTAPVQPGWVPASATMADAVATATHTELSAEGASDPDLSGSRQGGLARRVPGASLAESRGAELGVASSASAARSADGVRSMLSSFQAGRRRGRDVEPTPGSPDPSKQHDRLASSDADASEDPNTVHDGRFPQ